MAQNITNNLNLWDAAKSNYTTSTALREVSQVTSGFQINDPLQSAVFNGFFMELSLVTVSLVEALKTVTSSSTQTLTVDNTSASKLTLSTAIKDILEGLSVNYATLSGSAGTAATATNIAGGSANKLLIQTGAGTTGFVNTGNDGDILKYSPSGISWISPGTLSVSHAATANTATVANGVSYFHDDDDGANSTIAFTIGTGTNAKHYSKTITVNVPGTVTTASNLAGGIPGNIPYQSGVNTTSFIGVSDNSCLLGGGTTPSWQDKSSITVGNANKINNKTFDMSYNSSTHVLTITYHS